MWAIKIKWKLYRKRGEKIEVKKPKNMDIIVNLLSRQNFNLYSLEKSITTHIVTLLVNWILYMINIYKFIRLLLSNTLLMCGLSRKKKKAITTIRSIYFIFISKKCNVSLSLCVKSYEFFALNPISLQT